MKLEAGWVPVALSASIEAGTSAGAVVDGSEIVVWRDNSGKAHVWEDRCPHRGMRMSFGFVRGGAQLARKDGHERRRKVLSHQNRNANSPRQCMKKDAQRVNAAG